MAEVTRTQGVEEEKYSFFIPEDPQAAKEMEGKAWNHRKLKKVILNDYILSYQELLEMVNIYEAQVESEEKDLEILMSQIDETKDRIKEKKAKVKEWTEELEKAERDIPEIGEKAKAERIADEKARKQHEANLAGRGKGRALEMTSEE